MTKATGADGTAAFVCDWCHKPFEPPKRRRGPLPRYCCRSHRQRAYEARRTSPRPEASALLEQALAALETALADATSPRDVLAAYRRVADAAAALLRRPLPGPSHNSAEAAASPKSVTVTKRDQSSGAADPTPPPSVDLLCSADTRSRLCRNRARWAAGRPGIEQYVCGLHAKQYQRRGIVIRRLN